MQISPLSRYRWRLTLGLTLLWVCIGIIIEVNNALIYDVETDTYYTLFPFGNNPFEHLIITAVGPLIGGLLGGSLILFVLRDRLRKSSFAFKLIAQSIFFVALIFTLIMLVGAIQAKHMGGDFAANFVAVVFNLRVLRLLVTWFLVGTVTLLLLDVSEKYGKGVLWKIISGRYHHPRTEKRIFGFIDLKDSTALTEQLGDEQYFRMLRAVFFLTTEPVLNCEGEIYQYVGDEIILSWTMKKGVRHANCLRCLDSINAAITKKADDFRRDFGVVPVFRGAVHAGSVVIGEIGVVKKDVVFSGDVLNSTSRMLTLAKDHGRDIVCSDQIRKLFEPSSQWSFSLVDTIVLRGRSRPTEIYTVEAI